MNAPAAGALQEALRLVQSPAGLAEVRARAFPEDVTRLFRLVSGDGASMALAIRDTREHADALREAAEFFVQQICFTPGIDSYRVLGVDVQAPTDRIREHYRLLVRWLHPDRNDDAWQNVYLDRVNRAWRDLRSEEARAEYDLHRLQPEQADAQDDALAAGAGGPPPSWAQRSSTKLFSARAMRWLPGVVMSGLGVLAVGILGVMYVDHADEQRRAAELSQPAPERVSGRIERGAAPIVSGGGRPAMAPSAAAVAPAVGIEPPAPLTAASDVATDPPSAASAKPGPKPAMHEVTAPPLLSSVAPDAEPQPPVPPSADANARVAQTANDQTGFAMISAGADAADAPSSSNAEATDGSDDFEQGASAHALSTAAPDRRDRGQPDAQWIDDAVVSELLTHYRDAYDAGDLIGLMALFTRDARNFSDGEGHLADTYRQLFETSRSRRLALNDMSWWSEGDIVAVVASFDASITPVGRQRPRRLGGDIRFDLRREDGEVRIARIRHQTQ